MNKRLLALGQKGQNAPLEPAEARTLLAWVGGLAGCSSVKELAHRARLSIQTLKRFAAGKAGRGEPKTVASLLDVVALPTGIALEVMLPTLRTVHRFRCHDRDTRGALVLAARISWLELLARRVENGAREAGRRSTRTGLHPTDARVLIDGLQALGDWSRRDLAHRAGISHESLRMYADGAWPLERMAVQKLAKGAGVPAWLVEGLLLPAFRAVRRVVAHPRRSDLAATLRTFAAMPALEHLHDLDRGVSVSPEPSPADREAAEELWRHLQNRSVAERIMLVKTCPKHHSWAVVERLCTASREAATDSVKEALRLSLLALRAARCMRGEARLALQGEGFAFVHIANAWRVFGQMQRADKAYSRGLLFWQAGEATWYPLFPGWRVLDLGGSLRRDQARFGEAIGLLDCSRKTAPRAMWPRILLKKATVLSQKGEPEAAVAVLQEAATLSDAKPDPALVFRCRFMMAAALCQLGRHQEAQALMPETIALSAVHGGALDNLRLDGLRGRIAAGLGRREEALAAFAKVREEFHRLGMAFDYALLSLEAGEILLQEGRYDEVEALALEMEWIFRTEGISTEAEKALDLFRKAAAARTATPELAGKVVRFLVRAQHDPELRFAA